jgi:NAD(P)-dependent dehydrogenase (short-subunit alcohol dehydrogenase family)
MGRDIGRRMRQRGQGIILNMGWDQADTGMEGDSGELFAASKGAVMAFSKSLAKSLAPEVRVNCLAPGWVRTAWGETASSRWQDRVVRETPLGRWGTPEDVAAAACWLASPAASFITGQVIRVNGGAVR